MIFKKLTHARYCKLSSYSVQGNPQMTSKTIRRKFLNYFIQDLKHSFVRSSPVVPLTDEKFPFINAGMNQFKGIFLGYHEAPVSKVANIQKCIRVGGKHNDLDVVGHDTYHHTFFEMLGNWSFHDYFKEDACKYAWNLLTGPYGIQKEFLYVTYFGGNEELGLKEDIESKEIWMSLGVPKSRIISLGMQDNFWEMGLSGPCGPCTEIHIDRNMVFGRQSNNIKSPDLMELWNIVFIQYERLLNGSIISLAKHHVDTGMGFERLVAILQKKESNYDTDLFRPIFKTIKKCTNAPDYQGKFGRDDENGIDYGYRLLADHARMITVSLSDGVIPAENNKLRKVIRKAIEVGEEKFKKSKILSELVHRVSDDLGEVYVELQINIKQAQTIIEFEEELYKKLRDTSGNEWKNIVKTRPELNSITDWTSTGLVVGYKDFQSYLKTIDKPDVLPGDIVFKLYDTHGLSVETIAELAQVESVKFDENIFHKEMDKVKYRSKSRSQIQSEKLYEEFLEIIERNGIPRTDDSSKYNYTFDGNNYNFPDVQSRLIGLLVNGRPMMALDTLNANDYVHLKDLIQEQIEIGLIMDKTPCYSVEGGQISDKGVININSFTFNIESVKKINGYVIHLVKLANDKLLNPELKLRIDDSCVVSINKENREEIMKHHTATHLLNAALRSVLDVIYQRGSTVTNDVLKFQFNSFGHKLSTEHLKKIELIINQVIRTNVPVSTKTIDILQLSQENNITIVPKEIYPYTGIRVVKIDTCDFKSKEACCGTHVHATGVLEQFCLLNYTTKGHANGVIKAATGRRAKSAQLMGEKFISEIKRLKENINTRKIEHNVLETEAKKLISELNNKTNEIPYLIKNECLKELQDLIQISHKRRFEIEKNSIINELTNAIDPSSQFLVHCIQKEIKHLLLDEVITLCPSIPSLIITNNKGAMKAICAVPQEIVSDTLNAQIWLNTTFEMFNMKASGMQGFNPLYVAKVVEKKSPKIINESIQEVTNTAKMFITSELLSRDKISKEQRSKS